LTTRIITENLEDIKSGKVPDLSDDFWQYPYLVKYGGDTFFVSFPHLNKGNLYFDDVKSRQIVLVEEVQKLFRIEV